MSEMFPRMRRGAVAALCGVALAPVPAQAEPALHLESQPAPPNLDHASPRNPNVSDQDESKNGAILRIAGYAILFSSALTVGLLSDKDWVKPFGRNEQSKETEAKT